MKNGIAIKDVSFGYTKELCILKNLSLQVMPGDFIGVVGANGSGKSTFACLLNGLIPHAIRGYLTGDITVDDSLTREQNVAFFARKVGLLFQNPDFSLFNLTVKDEIAFGLKNLNFNNIEARINDALAMVGLRDYATRDPQTLSLGEKQKVCLASILALDNDYIVLDEPVAMLDYKSSLEIYALLQKLNQIGKTIIVIEHDTDYLWRFARRIIAFANGEIIADNAVTTVFTDRKLLNQMGVKSPNVQATIST